MEKRYVQSGAIIPLGRQGENLARCIIFDVSGWVAMYGIGKIMLLHQRKKDENPYPAKNVNFNQDSNTIEWLVDSVDNNQVGMGRAELRYYVGEVLVKSAIFSTRTSLALAEYGEIPPEDSSWLDDLLAAAAAIKDSAAELSNYVRKEEGKGLSSNDYTTAEKTKLSGIAESAQVNTIEEIKVNNTALPIFDKSVNINLSDIIIDLSDCVRKEEGKGLSSNDYTTAEKTKLSGIAESAQVNTIEEIKVNNTALPISGKSVNIDLDNYVVKEAGKSLSSNDYTTEEKNKLSGIADNAQVNLIETIKVNGTTVTPVNKVVNISTPTKANISEAALLAFRSALPSNTLISDDTGTYGTYVQIPTLTLDKLLTNGDPSIVHPAFIVSGQQQKIYIGKFQGFLSNNKIYSLPGKDPSVQINFDKYAAYCRDKGSGHHCITVAEWGFLALFAKKNGTLPLGNTAFGKDTSETIYRAIPSYSVNGETYRVATGTGPLKWSHTWDAFGVWDLTGNISEFISGIRLIRGELQVIPYNNAALPIDSTRSTSASWRAINGLANSYNDLYISSNGKGTTTNSVKLDMIDNHWQWDTSISEYLTSSQSGDFSAITISSNISAFCSMYLRALALAPDENDTNYGNSVLYGEHTTDERLASRGGHWDCANGNIFTIDFRTTRSDSVTNLGSRPAYYN